MKILSLFSAVLLLGFILLFTSCSKDEEIVIPQADDQTELIKFRAVKPFKGEYTTNVQVPGPPIGGILTIYIEAEGNATHLGNSTWNGIQLSFLPVIPTDPQNILCDSVTFIAANGDMLTGWYDGLGYGNPFSPQGVTFEGSVYITQGTGRFEDASGEFPYYGSAVLDPANPGFGYGEISFYDGTLEY